MYLLPDVTNIQGYGDLSSQIAQGVGNNGLNLLINNAGVATKFTKIHMVKAEQLIDNLTINTVAPIMLTKVNKYKYQKQKSKLE